MHLLMLAVLVFFASLQADARYIAVSQETPKFLQEYMALSLTCGMEMGPRAASMPVLRDFAKLPEDNDTVNEQFGCIYVKKRIITRGNKVNVDNLRSYILGMMTMNQEENHILRVLANYVTDSCKNVNADDYRLKSVRLEKCIYRVIQEMTPELLQSLLNI